MPKMTSVNIHQLHLDLDNFRTVHQKNESHAIDTMIAISPSRFWALLDSLLEDGYHATENIILLDINGKYIVKEGNRRIAALKIIFGIIKDIDLPYTAQQKISNITDDWKKENELVPCSIFRSSEVLNVDRIIALIHAKGETAGRDHWAAVARARYDRDQKGQSEPGLDLLEKYLEHGKLLSDTQAERWSGDYPLTVLNEAIQKLIFHIHFKSTAELVSAYPKKNKTSLDKIIYAIGIHNLDFKKIRDKQKFFGDEYGIPQVIQPSTHPTPSQPSQSSQPSGTSLSPTNASSNVNCETKQKAQALNEPKAVYRKLKSFTPRGNGREKVVTLLNEIKKLKIDTHPHAFCFLLRSMFEISAKAYCADFKSSSGPLPTKTDGKDKNLADLLRDITNHMTNNKSDKERTRLLHGAITEIAKKDGILSATSMNQLVHNPYFSILPSDISILFGNVFPLLDEMNK